MADQPNKMVKVITPEEYSPDRSDRNFYQFQFKKTEKSYSNINFWKGVDEEVLKVREKYHEGFYIKNYDELAVNKDSEKLKALEEKVVLEYQNGYTTGLKEGVKHTNQKIISPIMAINSAIKEVVDFKTSIFKDAENQLIELSIKIAEQIIRREIDKNSLATLKKTVAESFENLPTKEKYSIFLAPEDIKAINESKEELLDPIQMNIDFEIFPDPKVSKGSCIIKTNNLEVNNILEKQFEKMVEEIKSRLQ